MLHLRTFLHACSALLLVAGWSTAQAQATELDIQNDEPSATRCLARSIEQPAYPPDGDAAGAVVRVKLDFTRPDAAPGVEVTYDNGSPAFVAEVRRFVAGYRLPCLAAGQQASALQEFQFMREKPVLHGDFHEGGKQLPEECKAAVQKWDHPNVPRGTRSGNVLVRFKFVSMQAAPEVQVLYNGGNDRLANAVVAAAEDFRLPCPALTFPFQATQLYAFRWDWDAAPVLKDKLTLPQLLGIVRPADRQGVRFDFRTMRCPFQIEVAPQMPFAPNRVRQLSEPGDDRMEFTAWLRRVQFEIPPKTMATMFGSPTRIDVPCAILDLT